MPCPLGGPRTIRRNELHCAAAAPAPHTIRRNELHGARRLRPPTQTPDTGHRRRPRVSRRHSDQTHRLAPVIESVSAPAGVQLQPPLSPPPRGSARGASLRPRRSSRPGHGGGQRARPPSRRSAHGRAPRYRAGTTYAAVRPTASCAPHLSLGDRGRPRPSRPLPRSPYCRALGRSTARLTRLRARPPRLGCRPYRFCHPTLVTASPSG